MDTRLRDRRHASGLFGYHTPLPARHCVSCTDSWGAADSVRSAQGEFRSRCARIALHLLTTLPHGVMRSKSIACYVGRGRPTNDRTAKRIRPEPKAMQSHELYPRLGVGIGALVACSAANPERRAPKAVRRAVRAVMWGMMVALGAIGANMVPLSML